MKTHSHTRMSTRTHTPALGSWILGRLGSGPSAGWANLVSGSFFGRDHVNGVFFRGRHPHRTNNKKTDNANTLQIRLPNIYNIHYRLHARTAHTGRTHIREAQHTPVRPTSDRPQRFCEEKRQTKGNVEGINIVTP